MAFCSLVVFCRPFADQASRPEAKAMAGQVIVDKRTDPAILGKSKSFAAACSISVVDTGLGDARSCVLTELQLVMSESSRRGSTNYSCQMDV
jgi:hypothetical protein